MYIQHIAHHTIKSGINNVVAAGAGQNYHIVYEKRKIIPVHNTQQHV